MKPASPYEALETEPPLDYSVLSLELCKPKDFRLLEVRRTYEGGVIKCDLRVDNLENNYPKYRALSYTWGPATRHELDRLPGGASDNEQRKHGILCNQQLLLVTKNLYDFLQQLSQASPLENEAIRYFWIDSICINQEDPDERASQVNMMSDIYRHAEEVVIWLGKSDEDTTLACNLVKKLGYLSQNERDSLDLESLRSKENITTPLGESHTSAHWKAVVELFGRTWFTRAWVVQEYVLARDVVVLCGSLTLEWAHIVETSGYLATRASNNMLNSSVSTRISLESSSYKTPARLAAVKNDLVARHPEVLLRSLIRCRGYDCLKPEDKIYSLLGIHQAIHGPLLPQDKLYPNYALCGPDSTRVYVDAAVHLLTQGSDLALLTVAEGSEFRNIKSLPSWVPDWSFGLKTTSLGLGITGYTRFNAAGSHDRVVTFSKDERTLFVEAAQLDNILEVGESKYEVDMSKPFHKWLSILSSLQSVYHTGESRFETFWRTLITNTSKEGYFPAPDELSVGFLEWWLHKKVENLPQDARQKAKQLVTANGPNHNALRQDASLRLAFDYDIQYCHSLYQRLFSTSRGYLGIGSQSLTEEGKNSVWIVKGSRVPLIFRMSEDDNLYRLVGGAYVHGFMQGEALKLPELEFKVIGLI